MATDYRVPCVQAAAAKRVKEYMADLYGVSVDLLTDFIPFMYGDSLTPKPLNKDEHGLRRFIAEMAALDHLERVEACEMDRYIAEYPDFAGKCATSIFWSTRMILLMRIQSTTLLHRGISVRPRLRRIG